MKYLGGWKPGDFAIYSDFGLRSLYIVRVVEWPTHVGDTIEHLTILGATTHDWRDGDVRAEIVDTTLVDWDFGRPVRISPHQQEGSIRYYHYENLYRSIEDLIGKQGRITYPEVQVRILYDLRKHPGWIMLAAYGLRNGEGGGQHRYEQTEGHR